MSPVNPVGHVSGLLAGRTILVTGVLRPTSIATSIAALAHQEGARVLLTGALATISATQSLARRLGLEEALALDASDPVRLAGLETDLRAAGVERLDGLVHAIAHADRGLLGSVLPDQETTPEQAALRQRGLQKAFTTSAASLAELTQAVRPLLAPGASVVALTFESTRVHPGYGWMGPLKAALESSVRYLAAELGGQGVRVNALSCGPLRTPAASVIPGLGDMAARWARAAPLGWEAEDAQPVARSALALLSDWLPATTGQVLRVDGGAFLAGP